MYELKQELEELFYKYNIIGDIEIKIKIAPRKLDIKLSTKIEDKV